MQKTWVKPFLISIGLAVLALVLWLVEMTQRIGWDGSEWLSAFHYSILIIAVFAIAAYLLPFYWLFRFPFQRILAAGTELYFVFLAAYFLEKAVLLTLFSRFYLFSSPYLTWSIQPLVLILTALSFFFVTQRWLQPLRWQHPVLVGSGIFLSLILSLITVKFIPAFNGHMELWDAVKMGYPFFWIVLLMGIVGIVSTHLLKETQPPLPQDNILDDHDF